MYEINYYAIDYIRRILESDTTPTAPNRNRAGRYNETLVTLHEAHLAGGVKSCRLVWDTTISKLRPEIYREFAMLRYVYSAVELSTIPKLTYMLDEYAIYEGASNLLVGARGTGKSFFGVDVASRVAQTNNVLYIAAEGAGVYDARVRAWHDYHQLQMSSKLHFYGRSVNTGDANEFEQWVQIVVEPLEPSLVVVDTVARCMLGMDENSSSDMKLFVERWDRLRQRGITLLFIHHTNRTGSQRGSGVLDDAVDSVLMLYRADGMISVRNDVESGGKNRGNKEAPPVYFKIQSHELAPDYIGEDAAAVIVKGERKDIALNEMGGITEKQREVMAVLDGLDDGLSATEIIACAEGLSTATVYRQLNSLVKEEYIVKKAGLYSLTDKGQDALDANHGGDE